MCAAQLRVNFVQVKQNNKIQFTFCDIKSLLNGKKETCMLSVNQMNVSKEHHSAAVVTVCMLLRARCIFL